EKYDIRGRDMAPMDAHFVPFSAQTRLSGVDFDHSSIRKGAVDAVLDWVRTQQVGDGRGGVATTVRTDAVVKELRAIAESIAKAGGTPLAVAKDSKLL